MFIEEMVVAGRSHQAQERQERGEQEAHRRWQQHNQETLLL